MLRPTEIRAVDAKGKRTVIHGAEIPLKKQKDYFRSAKVGRLPKDAVRLEMWECTRQHTGINQAAQDARLDEAKAEAKADVKPEPKAE